MYKDHKYFAFSSNLKDDEGDYQTKPVQSLLDELNAGATIIRTSVLGGHIHYITAKVDISAAQGTLSAFQTVEVPAHG